MDHFIEKVKLHACLWDTNHRYYRDAAKKDSAWEQIAKDCDMDSAKEAKLQWKKIRDSHREGLRRRRIGQSATHLKPWKYEAQMEFVLPHMDIRTGPLVNFDNESDKDSAVGTSDSSIVTEYTASPTESTVRVPNENGQNDFLQERDIRRGQRQAEREKTRKQEFDMNRFPQDALSNLFTSLCQKTRELPKHLQLRVQREVFDAVARAEEEAMSFHAMAGQPAYANSPSEFVTTVTVTKRSPYDSEDEC